MATSRVRCTPLLIKLREIIAAACDALVGNRVGPHGSGKSTLLKALARLLRPGAGLVYLDAKAITTLPLAAIARELAILPQGPSLACAQIATDSAAGTSVWLPYAPCTSPHDSLA